MSVYSDSVRSPLEHVFRQFIPQGHDTALRNAFYNVAAVVFVAAVGAAAWNVYLIFQPFLRPLLWAVLCGSLLHPIKHTVTAWLRRWLNEVQASNNLLSISCAFLPLRFFDNMSEVIARFVMSHMKGVVTVTVVLPLVYMVFHHTPTFLSSLAYTIFAASAYVFTTLFTIFTTYHLLFLTLVLGYIITVSLWWSEETHHKLKSISFPMWVVLAAAVSGSLWPSCSVVVFILICFMLLAGAATEVADVYNTRKLREGEDVSLLETVFLVCGPGENGSLEAILGNTQSTDLSLSDDGEDSVASGVEEINNGENGAALLASSPLSTIAEDQAIEEELDTQERVQELDKDEVKEDKKDDTDKNNEPQETVDHNKTATKVPNIVDELYLTPSLNSPRPMSLHPHGTPSRALPPQTPYTPDHSGGLQSGQMSDNNSTVYMKGVFIACILVELWRHNYLLPLLPMAMIYYFIKKFASRYISWSIIRESVFVGRVEEYGVCFQKWLRNRRAVFLPAPIRGIAKLCVRTDHSCVQVLMSVIDAVVTLLLICAVIFFTVVFSLYLAVQIQGESMHLVSLGSAVINSTMVSNPEFLALLPEGMNEVVSSALDDAYLYGRQWIQSMVRGMLGETDDAKAAMLEKQVVELWDRVYQAWVAAHPQAPFRGPVVTSEAVAMSFDSLLEGLKSPDVSFSFLSEVVRDNLGTVLSVLESIWAILLGNLSLAVSTLTAATSVLLMGSLSLLNALINGVVFMSALFYVLSTSDSVYKPVSILSNLAPGQMNKLGGAVEQAVNGVFIASMRMGAFYGCWTWLLHSVFATNIVYIPAVLGALFGAVPLVGTYWAALPGCVELCWGHGSPMLAALLFAAQLLPMSCVDTAIYSDIKGGGHPYLTGLAVAGGIFTWGSEGAILGPLLLCILLVGTNMYSTLVQSPHGGRFAKLRRNSTIL